MKNYKNSSEIDFMIYELRQADCVYLVLKNGHIGTRILLCAIGLRFTGDSFERMSCSYIFREMDATIMQEVQLF